MMIRVVAQRGRGYSPAEARMDSDEETALLAACSWMHRSRLCAA